ncbi:Uncharacterised protein [Neisseria gonorrhoeae]|uniref:Uncharacterized protein n=1 Tax=Neisseria gonorrhoeae TaxID=485 RepID=A0A378VTY7_NEIGO|nr:Uncharacterised protein [Neisseria gonorrhoeae]
MVGNRADFTVKQCRRIGMDTQNIGGRTGGNFRYKRTERFFLYFFFNLQCVIFIFEGNISANLVQTLVLSFECCTDV